MVNRNTHMHHYRLLINGIKFSDSGADVCDRRNEVIATSNQCWAMNKKVREIFKSSECPGCSVIPGAKCKMKNIYFIKIFHYQLVTEFSSHMILIKI